MKPQNRTCEEPFAAFLREMRKVLAIRLLLAVFLLSTSILAIFSATFGIEYLFSLSIALCILLTIGYVLLSAYFSDFIKAKAVAYCKKIVQETSEEHSGSLESTVKALTHRTQDVSLTQFTLFHGSGLPRFFVSACNRFGRFFAWDYFHTFTEALILASLDTIIEYAKAAPLQIHPHATLANCYTMLASHYMQPIRSKLTLQWPGLWMSKNQKRLLEAKNRVASKMAVEELAILKTLAPHELWVHDQLAISYRELALPEEEICECEEIVRLCPEDHAAQLRLGALYFMSGRNGKGLVLYEHLKRVHPQLAEELISHYGSYKPFLHHSRETAQ